VHTRIKFRRESRTSHRKEAWLFRNNNAMYNWRK